MATNVKPRTIRARTRKTVTQPVEETSTFSNTSTFQPLSLLSYERILVVLLIVASFLLGSLWTKVQLLQGNGSLFGSGTQSNTQQTGSGTSGQAAAGAPSPTPGKVNVGVGFYAPQGDKNAKVKIIAFEDDRCPFCQQFMTQTEPQIIQNYVNNGKAVLYFRDYPFLGPASTLAANANGCANEQGKFWDWIDYMYKNQPTETDTSMYTNDNLTNIAGQLGMDTNQFSDCMTSNKYAKQNQQDLSEGQKAGVSGTPTIFVNGTAIVGAQPYSAFQQAIDAALK